MKALNIFTLSLGAWGFIGMIAAGYFGSLLLLGLSIGLLLLAYAIWEIAWEIHYQELLEERIYEVTQKQRLKDALPKCLGGNGLNHFR